MTLRLKDMVILDDDDATSKLVIGQSLQETVREYIHIYIYIHIERRYTDRNANGEMRLCPEAD